MKCVVKFCKDILGITNINPKKSGLSVIIWPDHNGISRNTGHNMPRLKIDKDECWIVVSIEADPKILTQSIGIKKSDMAKLREGMKYAARNYDLFLKHFMDTDFTFDDEDLFNALRSRGDYI